MPVHTVHLIPALGHSSDAGTYMRGNSHGRLCELDIIDGYYPTVMEELDDWRVRAELMETRRHPGVRLSERPRQISPNTCVLELRCGWFGRPTKGSNVSRVLYGKGTPFALAEMLQDAVVEWGRCYVGEHRGVTPIEVDEPLLTVPGTLGFAIEPFALDGPAVAGYTARLAVLGRAIARVIASFALERRWATTTGTVRSVTALAR